MVVLLDDVGFAQLGCYGSSISTPRMDALAEGGIQYTNFHATALCSPTRASLLTGRNHHSVGMGFLAAFDTGFPSYRGHVTASAATIAETLRESGYGTYALGKWHLTPPRAMTPAGPFDQWPTQRGFDRYYGFLGGEDDQWTPDLWYDQHRVDPPRDPDYHLSEDLVDRACEFLADHRSSRPDDPFFLYLSFGACHAPHQAPRAFIDEYRGAFDDGWDVERGRVLARQVDRGIVPQGTELAPRNPGVLPWAELPYDTRQLYARMQEVFAGFMTHTDVQIGRLIDFLTAHDLLNNTLIILMSDNGASAEGGEHGTANEYRWFLQLPDPLEDTLAVRDQLGGPTTHGHYPIGWAQAGNTPGKFYKRFAYGGGVRVPLLMHWPKGLRTSHGLRTQFHHVIDIAPTLLQACGVSPPSSYRGVDQMPIHGTSMVYSFADEPVVSTRVLQYFETAGHRGIFADGWKAVARHQPGTEFDSDQWELYRLDEDFSECRDLAADMQRKCQELQDAWWQEAEKYQVLPLDDRMQARVAVVDPSSDRLRYEMLMGSRLLNGVAGPSFSAREFRITAHVGPWSPGDNGVLLAWGHRSTGLSFFVKDGRLAFDLNLGGRHSMVASGATVALGTTLLEMRLERFEGRARARLLADHRVMADGEVSQLVPAGMGLLSTQCGHNSPSPVSPEYIAPCRYQGTLTRVVIDLEPRDRDNPEVDWLSELAQQ